MPRGRSRKTEEALFKSAEFIGWALGGIEREIAATRERLAALTARAHQLRARVGTPTRGRIATATATTSEVEAVRVGRARRRRQMSPEARKRISEMLKKRWAERKRKGLKRL
jgi:hypothetical protein